MSHWTVGLHILISLFARNTSIHGIVNNYICSYLFGFLRNCWFVIHLRLMLSTLITSLVPGVEEIFQLWILPEDISTPAFAVWALRHFALLSIFQHQWIIHAFIVIRYRLRFVFKRASLFENISFHFDRMLLFIGLGQCATQDLIWLIVSLDIFHCILTKSKKIFVLCFFSFSSVLRVT